MSAATEAVKKLSRPNQWLVCRQMSHNAATNNRYYEALAGPSDAGEAFRKCRSGPLVAAQNKPAPQQLRTNTVIVYIHNPWREERKWPRKATRYRPTNSIRSIWIWLWFCGKLLCDWRGGYRYLWGNIWWEYLDPKTVWVFEISCYRWIETQYTLYCWRWPTVWTQTIKRNWPSSGLGGLLSVPRGARCYHQEELLANWSRTRASSDEPHTIENTHATPSQKSPVPQKLGEVIAGMHICLTKKALRIFFSCWDFILD